MKRAIVSIATVAALSLSITGIAPMGAGAAGDESKTFNSVLGPSETFSVSVGDWTFSTTADNQGNCQQVTIVNRKHAYFGTSDFSGPFNQPTGIPSEFVGPNQSSEGAATTTHGRENVVAIIATNDLNGSGKCWTAGKIW